MSSDKMRADFAAWFAIHRGELIKPGIDGSAWELWQAASTTQSAEIEILTRALSGSRSLSTEYFDTGLTLHAEIARLKKELAEAKAAPVQAQGATLDERAAFEAWLAKEWPLAIVKADASGCYVDNEMHRLWEGWDARAAQAQAPASDDVRDAERYRLLRDGDLDALAAANWGKGNDVYVGEQFDAAIDAAIAALKE